MAWNSRPHVGIVMDFPDPELVAGARDYCDQNGLFLDARWSVRGDWMPDSLAWDVIIARVNSNAQYDKTLLDRLHVNPVPKVWLMEGQQGPSVTLDSKSVGKFAAKELRNSGFRNLMALQLGTVADLGFSHGMQKYAESKGLGFSIYEGAFYVEKAIDHFVRAIMEAPKPLGVGTCHAAIAFSLEEELIKRGIEIGKDVGFVVLDKDLQETAAMAPIPISAVSPNSWHHGFLAAEMAHAIIEKRPLSEEHLLVPAKGVIRRESTGGSSERDVLIAQALGFVRKNFREPIDVTDVVEQVSVSRRVLELRFRALLNRGVHEEIARLRCDEAKRLLVEDPTLKIAEVAEQCGFASIYYFSAAFKRETGLSPRAYRKQMLKNEGL